MKPLGNCLLELRGTLNGMGHLFQNDPLAQQVILKAKRELRAAERCQREMRRLAALPSSAFGDGESEAPVKEAVAA